MFSAQYTLMPDLWGKAALWQDVITSGGTVNSFSSRDAKLRLLTLTGWHQWLLYNLSTQPSPTVSPGSPQIALEWKIFPNPTIVISS